MSRTLTAEMLAAYAAETLRPIVFVAADFPSGITRLTSAPYDITWDGYTWTGRGQLLSIDEIEESETLSARGVRIALSGIPPALVSLAFDEHYQGRDLTIWQGLLDAGHQVIADPYSPWAGRMDVMSIELGEAATITLTGAHRLADMDRPRGGRCNDADQQSRYPGDKFFEFLESMQNAQLVWGFPTVTSPPPGYVSNDSSGVGYSNRNTGPSRDVSLNGYSQSAGSTGRDRSSGTRGYS